MTLPLRQQRGRDTMTVLLDDAAVLIDNPAHDACLPDVCAEHYWHKRHQEGEVPSILLRDAFSLIQAEAENRGHVEPCREGEYDNGEGGTLRVACGVCDWLERHAAFTSNPPVPAYAKVVRERAWNVNQTWHYEGVFDLQFGTNRHKTRVVIERNAYDHQSSLRAERWDGTQWRFVAESPLDAAECKSISYTQKTAPKPGVGAVIPIGPVHFARDRNTLLDLAKDVLS